MDNSIRVNLIMGADLVKKIDEESKKLCISRSAFMNMALSNYIQSQNALRELPNILSVMRATEQKLNELESAN